MKNLLIIILLTGCMADGAVKSIDLELKPYFEEFDKMMMKETGKINRPFIGAAFVGSLNGKAVGACRIWNTGSREVLIERNFWDNASEEERENLILHELGHCALNLGHVNNYSIMNAYVLDINYFRNNRNKLIAELFNHAKLPSKVNGCIKYIE